MKASLNIVRTLVGMALVGTLPSTQVAAQKFGPAVRESNVSLPNPERMVSRGILEGVVKVQVEINEKGAVNDWLVLAVTDDAFVEPLSRTIMGWRFRPATRDGVAVPSGLLCELRFSKGDVVSLTIGEMVGAYMNQIGSRGTLLQSRVAQFSDLDAIPRPINIAQPPLPDLPPERQGGDMVVQFYIDQEGKVRMPVLADVDCDLELAAAAYDAVRTWSFEPPTVKGRPVIVTARQKFVFPRSSENK